MGYFYDKIYRICQGFIEQDKHIRTERTQNKMYGKTDGQQERAQCGTESAQSHPFCILKKMMNISKMTK